MRKVCVKEPDSGVSMLPMYALFLFMLVFIIGIPLSRMFKKRGQIKRYQWTQAIMIALSLILPVCLFAVFSISEDYHTLSYSVRFHPEGDWDYTLVLPIINNEELIDSLDYSKGAGELSVGDTNLSDPFDHINNKGVTIKSSGNISLESKVKDYAPHHDITLFLGDETRSGALWFWFSSNGHMQNNGLTLFIHMGDTHLDDINYGMTVYLNDGWNQVNVTFLHWTS